MSLVVIWRSFGISKSKTQVRFGKIAMDLGRYQSLEVIWRSLVSFKFKSDKGKDSASRKTYKKTCYMPMGVLVDHLR